jgi:hypothetical protein
LHMTVGGRGSDLKDLINRLQHIATQGGPPVRFVQIRPLTNNFMF